MSDIATSLCCLMIQLFGIGKFLECMSPLLENGINPKSKGAPVVMRPVEYLVRFAAAGAKSLWDATPTGTLSALGAVDASARKQCGVETAAAKDTFRSSQRLWRA